MIYSNEICIWASIKRNFSFSKSKVTVVPPGQELIYIYLLRWFETGVQHVKQKCSVSLKSRLLYCPTANYHLFPLFVALCFCAVISRKSEPASNPIYTVRFNWNPPQMRDKSLHCNTPRRVNEQDVCIHWEERLTRKLRLVAFISSTGPR